MSVYLGDKFNKKKSSRAYLRSFKGIFKSLTERNFSNKWLIAHKIPFLYLNLKSSSTNTPAIQQKSVTI